MTEQAEEQVIRLNLSDVRGDGSDEPISAALLELTGAAVEVVLSPREHMGAVYALKAARLQMERGTRDVDPLPRAAALLGAVLELLSCAAEVTSEGGSDG